MGAAVLEHVDRAVVAARHHDRRRSNIGADEVAGIRHLGFERHVVPGAAVKDAFDLALVDELVGVDPVRNDAEIVVGPHIVEDAADIRRCRHPLRQNVERQMPRAATAVARISSPRRNSATGVPATRPRSRLRTSSCFSRHGTPRKSATGLFQHIVLRVQLGSSLRSAGRWPCSPKEKVHGARTARHQGQLSAHL